MDWNAVQFAKIEDNERNFYSSLIIYGPCLFGKVSVRLGPKQEHELWSCLNIEGQKEVGFRTKVSYVGPPFVTTQNKSKAC